MGGTTIDSGFNKGGKLGSLAMSGRGAWPQCKGRVSWRDWRQAVNSRSYMAMVLVGGGGRVRSGQGRVREAAVSER